MLTPTAEELTELIHRGSAPRELPRRPVTANATEGDRAARGPELEDFARYVARRHTALLRTAYLLTGDRHAAEDLLQTALARTWLAWRRIREPAGVDTYARRVLVNTQRSFWLRRRECRSFS